MKPPRIVLIWDAAKNGRFICIAENINTENTDDKTNDIPLETAERKKKQ